MNRIQTCSMLALAVASVSTAAFGQVLHVGNPGVYGTPYATLGTAGANTWEMYNKYNDFGGAITIDAVTGTNTAGNATQATLANEYLGGWGGTGTPSQYRWGASGEVMVSPTVAATGYAAGAYQSTGVVYLKDLISNNTATWGTGGADANGHEQYDLRVCFVENPAGYVTAGNQPSAGKTMDPSENNGTRGIYLHFNTNNTGAATLGAVGNNWVGGVGPDGVGFMAPTTGTTKVPAYPVTTTLINSGVAPTTANDKGVAYNSAMEVSGKMFLDPTDLTNNTVIAQVKLGNTISQYSFQVNDARFGATPFNWAAAKPMIYTGNGNWGGEVATAHLGVLAKGDANADGKVNAADTNILRTNFGAQDKTWSQGDFTQDGKTNAADTNALRAAFGVPVTGPTLSAGAASLQAGQPAAGKIDLIVDTATGHIQLAGGAGASLSGYEIDSASGALDPTQWSHLSGFALFGNTANTLSETNFGTGPSLDGTSVDIGAVFRTGGAHDLTFMAFDNAGNEVESGIVTYVAVPEPTTIGLLGLGAMTLIARRRKVA